MDSLWMHPAHVSTPEASPITQWSSTAGGPFQQREMLVCSLCVYLLEGHELPVDPSLPTMLPAELRTRLESSGLAVDAPAAMRLNSRRWDVPIPLEVLAPQRWCPPSASRWGPLWKSFLPLQVFRSYTHCGHVACVQMYARALIICHRALYQKY